MALSVDFKDKLGHYTLNYADRKFKIFFCGCNALVADIYFYTDAEDGEKRASLQSFFGDVEHLKRCAKNGLLKRYEQGITLYAKKMNNDLWKMARIFAEQGIKVTIK